MLGRALSICLAFVAFTGSIDAATAQSTTVTTAHLQFDDLVAAAKAEMQIAPQETVEKARRARRVAQASGFDVRDRQIATTYWLEGEALVRLNRLDDAAPLIERGVSIAKRAAPRSRLEGDLLLSRGGIAVERADVGEALIDYQTAFEIFRLIGETRSQSRTLIQIASLYTLAKDYQTALKYFNQALDVYRGDPGLLVSLYNGRGNAYVASSDFEAAGRDFARALTLTRQMRSGLLSMVVLSNVARTYVKAGRPDRGWSALNEAIRISAVPEGQGFRTMLFGLAAQAANDQREFARARHFTERAFDGIDLNQTTLIDRDAHEAAYKIYAALHRDDLALPHLAAVKRLDDEATALARSTNAALMAARFDFANQEVKIARLKADDLQKTVAFERARAATQRWLLIGGTGIAVVVVSMLAYGLVTIRRSRNEVSAANVDLAASNAALGKALAAKTEFLATTSHEIRTPLNGILGMTQVMLADPGVAGATRDRLTVVHGAGITMRALVDDILDVAKMETGNLTLEEAPFALDETLREAARLWQEQAAGKGVGFHLDLADCPGRIVGDAARVRQLLFNLASNALKFTANGAVTVRAARHGADRWRLSVRDTGIGIPADKQAEIFESFRQADAGTTRQFGGTGLGLTICRSLAEAMGGTITVESVAGEGACFTVDLPLVGAAETPAMVAPRCEAWLVVDRNPITRAMLKAVLAPRAPSVVAMASLSEAQAWAADNIVCGIVVDALAIDDAATLSALAARADTVVLAAAVDPVPPGVRVIHKPIGRDALVDELFATPLVSQAA